jgi:hypothetical protein
MRAYVAAGASFLLAVLWFDLMFDVEAWGIGDQTLPREVIASISTYYRRVTIEASPMGQFVAIVMLATLIAIIAQIATKAAPRWIGWVSLVLASSAMALALVRTVPNAVKLGRGLDDDIASSHLIRLIFGDHLYAIAAIAAVVILQLTVRTRARRSAISN